MAPSAEPSRPVDAIDSAALSRSIAAGDEAAFAAFYEAWFGATLALARTASGRDEEFCLDVVQDVMMIVAKKMPALRDAAAVGAWMRSTVVRAVVDVVRRDERRRRREERLAETRAEAVTREPWQELAAGEQRRWLAARLDELSDQDRELLLARYSPAITVTAAGALLGLGPDPAHGRFRRALERLRLMAAEWM